MIPPTPSPARNALALAAALTLCALPAHAIVDLNGDRLDDVWQEYYGAQSLNADLDEDGDGGSNLAESETGTDPFDPNSRLQGKKIAHPAGSDSVSFTFNSERGKSYAIEIGKGLASGAMVELPTAYHGTGGDLTVTLDATQPPSAKGAVLHDVWTGVDPNTDVDVFPTTPDATEAVAALRSPSNVADNYVGRMRGWLVPNKTGQHTFYLTVRGSAELYLGRDSNPGTALAPVASAASDIMAPEQWTHADAASYTVGLTAGQRYYIEVRHQHGTGSEHCAVGWRQPTSPVIIVHDPVDVGGVRGAGGAPDAAEADEPKPGAITLIGGENLIAWSRDEPPTAQLAGAERIFIRVSASDLDQDGDSITDWAEKQMGGDHNFYFAHPKSTSSGSDDITTLTSALAGGGQTVTLSRSVVVAHEDDRSGEQIDAGISIAEIPPDSLLFQLSRTGSLQPLAIQYTIGSTGQQSSSPTSGADFAEQDIDGNPISGTLVLPFGHVATQVVLTPVADGVHEYPEKLRFAVVDAGGPGAGDYDLGATFQTDATIYDARDIPQQELLFVGRSSEDPNHTTTTKGTAIVSGFLNGRKDYMRLNSLIMAPFSSPQNDSHIHKANPGPLNGPIIYEITEVPGDPESDPKIGELLDYPWPIHDIQGSSTGTQVIDGLFGQNAETPIYLNWHTNDNQGGELWAIFGEESGSIQEPDPPADPPAITTLAGADLEREVRRFLNQASFGATDAEVAYLLNEIATTHAGAPVPRIAAYEAWIDDQINNVPQSYFVDYVLAADNQEWKLRGFFDPSRWFTNEFNDPANPPIVVPSLPSAWPTIDRSRPDPNEWFPVENYPLNQNQINWGRNENKYTYFDLGEVNYSHRRRAHWLFMANARDQLRQKMGYSLQQILVIAETLSRIQQDHLAASNYQDMLNLHAFAHFHDLFAFINRSPAMGKWLSSLKNQKAYDLNGDMVPDVFPDENLAREDMQLFSIGLFNLWTDGTLKLSEQTGLPEPTYNNEDITEFARVLTGQSFARYANNASQWGIDASDSGDPFDTNNANGGILFNENNPTGGSAANRLTTVTNNFGRGEGNKYYNHQFSYPMQMFADFHDLGVKTLAGGKLIDNTSMSDGDVSGSGSRADEIAHAEKDLDDAIAWLAGKPGDGLPDYDMVNSHRSTPAFLSLRLIQRFTTSNPSSAYLYRVAKAFKDSEGGMTETIKAILLDYEARELALADSDSTIGLKKSPLDLYLQLLRNFSQRYDTTLAAYTEGAFSELPLDASKAVPGGVAPAPPADGYLANFGYPASQLANFTINSRYRYFNTDNQLSMTPFAQETVFNFYLPLYSPGGSVANAGMVAPELQIATETAVIQNVNMFWTATWSTNGQSVNTIGGDPGQNAAQTENKPGPYNQRLLYGDPTPDDSHVSDVYDNVRIALVDWALNVIPWGTTAADRLADVTAMVDAIDLRLTGGRFATRYAYDPSDDEDLAADGINPTKTTYGDLDMSNDKELKNPREIIIDGLVGMSYNPYSTNSTTAQNAKRDLFRTALYLMSTNPEFVVQK